jgi:hypothetical protein
MDSEHEMYRVTLAQIITSDLVGGLHLRRVGELLIATEQLNERALAGKGHGQGVSGIMDDQFAETQFVETASMLERKICEIWYSCRRSNLEWRHDVGLKKLADALKEAADFYDRAAESWLDGK